MLEVFKNLSGKVVEPLLIGLGCTLAVLIVVGVVVLGILMRSYKDETTRLSQGARQ